MIGERSAEAKKVLAQCVGKKGVWASPHRYRDTCWTRDLALSVSALAANGHADAARRHLEGLARRQSPEGKIPVLFVDSAIKLLLRKTKEALVSRRSSCARMALVRFFSQDGWASFSPWTRDSELNFLFAANEYGAVTHDHSFMRQVSHAMHRAVGYIERNLIKEGVMHGADWRDSRPDLEPHALLTNNCLLYAVYLGMREPEKAEATKRAIEKLFWVSRKGHYRNFPGTNEFDLFGNALALLCGVAEKERAQSIFEAAQSFRGERGYVQAGVTLPAQTAEEATIMARVQKRGIIFPFMNYVLINAMARVGRADLAAREFETVAALPGFAEWYDPSTGKGYGSSDQLWSAARYLDAQYSIGRCS